MQRTLILIGMLLVSGFSFEFISASRERDNNEGPIVGVCGSRVPQLV